jgi:hypothetical protein
MREKVTPQSTKSPHKKSPTFVGLFQVYKFLQSEN